MRAGPQIERTRLTKLSIIDDDDLAYHRRSYSDSVQLENTLLTSYEAFEVQKLMESDDTNVVLGVPLEPVKRRKTVKLELAADLSVLTPALVAMTVAVQKTSSPVLIERCFKVMGSWMQFFFSFEKLVLKNMAELTENIANQVFLKLEIPVFNGDEPFQVVTEIILFT